LSAVVRPKSGQQWPGGAMICRGGNYLLLPCGNPTGEPVWAATEGSPDTGQ